ncbi:MAG: SLAC1 anion channel family protein [Campylobacter sp.]|nr:SLAC1 anion channel family protein [Campylobacter sp.]
MKEKIANFPIMFFAVIMGLGGLSIAYEKLNLVFEISDGVGAFLRCFTSFVFAVILAFYVAKICLNFSGVKAEFSHVIKINFFAAVPISLLLLSILWQKNVAVFNLLFYTGTAIMSVLTLYVISFWINKNLEIKHSNPAWFIPIVGNLLVIIASRDNEPWLWYYFSIGIFFYVVLFAIIFYRILFHDQLPMKFMPTLFIFIAPPAIAFLGVVKLTGEFNTFSMILLNLGLFFAFLVIFMWQNFIKVKFFLSWWAFTFPTAAISIAVLRAYELSSSEFFAFSGIFFFIMLVCEIVYISYFTIKNTLNGEIFKPE